MAGLIVRVDRSPDRDVHRPYHTVHSYEPLLTDQCIDNEFVQLMMQK